VESSPVLDVLERVTGSLQMQAKEKQISLGVEIPKDMPHTIEADQALLHQALYNLVENALKYTPEGGEVTVHLETLPTALTFAVQDSGLGIPKNDMPRLFESIAERHGGRVWAESELGKGSIFYLQIPLSQSKEAQRV